MAETNIIQKENFDAIYRLVNNFKKDSVTRHSVAYFETRQKLLETRWNKCEENHLATKTFHQDNQDMLARYMVEYEAVENFVLETATTFHEKLYNLQASTAIQGSSSVAPPSSGSGVNDAIRLERVKIPVFDGTYQNWIAFRDLYRSMIHENANIAAVQKLQYLRSSVQGEASGLINHLSVTGDNYSNAWDLLCQRYDNNKFISQELTQRWFNIRQCQVNDVAGLKRIVDMTNQLTASLQNLNINKFDLLSVFVLNTKLDRETQKEWQKHISNNNNVAELAEFLDFVKQRFLMLESLTLTLDNNKPTTNHCAAAWQEQVLLGTALLTLKTRLGDHVTFRALLDSGSQKSFIRESAVQRLGIPRNHSKVVVGGIGANESATTKGLVSLEAVVSSEVGDIDTLSFTALILHNITTPLPTLGFETISLKHLSGIRLADPLYNTPSRIDVLLGADVYGSLLENGLIQGHPCAQKTKLGWVLFGPIKESAIPSYTSLSLVATDELDRTLRRFWEIEEPSAPLQDNKDAGEVEQHYLDHTKRSDTGRYIVKLPFKPDSDRTVNLRDSLRPAFVLFRQLEQRLKTNPSIRKQYHDFMEEYLKLNHMERVPNHLTQSDNCYYLPHHEVIKDCSSTTKLRVVFNASQRSPGGKSLNDVLHPGPPIQNNIVHVLMRWREHRYVIAADIAKMYRQIEVHESDRDFQRILWRFHPTEPIQHFRLNTVTYGVTSAPFLAIRTLHKIANDEKTSHPEAAEVILRDFYVDDIFTGANDLEELLYLQTELNLVLSQGGFHLRKWTANHQALLDSIPAEDREIQQPLNIALDEEVRTLGIQWHPTQDEFSFKVQPLEDRIITKRSVLSDVAKLYDPLGWLQPCIITGKIAMQKLWLLKLEWDDEIPTDAIQDWILTREQLPLLETIRIPRWIGSNDQKRIELHGFCDASSQAYAAVIYLRVRRKNGSFQSVLLSSKTRVAPLKTISIPRLELSSAVLLVETMKQIKRAHGWNNISTTFWTDATIVLSWIQKPAASWKVFVANRVSIIQQESTPSQWNHVSTRDNPADLASRGMLPKDLLNCPLWWNGPCWLSETTLKISAATPSTPEQECTISDEYRSKAFIAVESTPEPELLLRYSSFTRLLKVTALVQRFIFNLRNPKEKRSGSVSCEELKEAETICIKLAQRHAFRSEMQLLQQKSIVSRCSPIHNLSPWIDAKGVLRVGGRLHNSHLQEENKHQAIIPKGALAELIIRDIHYRTLHGGLQTLLNLLLQRFWIPKVKSLAKRISRKCMTCFRATARPSDQLMGQLPPPRVQLEKPFTETGVDYAGPITIKWSSGRGAKTTKAYIAVFVCMATKAFHLELASDLSSATCIAAIRRFIARRGRCKTFYSDCGTNFVGADKQLQRAFATIQQKCAEDLAIDAMEWKFLPPGSPHFGGLWEAGVKSLKRHLVRTIGEQLLNVEEMITLLAEIEACLNSRPLCEVSTDPNDVAAITPGHFLTGKHLFEVPATSHFQTSLKERYEMVEKLRNHFWKRWSIEYLSRLQQRPKWTIRRENLKKGDLVLVKRDQFPSTKWPLARVEEVHPAADGVIRVVTIKVHGRITRCPIVRICRLPFENADPETKSNESAHSNKELNDKPANEETLTAQPTKRKRPRIAPISKVWRETSDIRDRQGNNKETTSSRGGASTTRLSTQLFLCTMVLCCCLPTVLSNVNVTQLTNGLYIEHIGSASLHRGSLQINVHIPWSNLGEDEADMATVSKNISNLCITSSRISLDIDCIGLVQHIQELEEEVTHKINTLRFLKIRQRRGLVGTMLTALFGVNDEAYRDIDSLFENQGQLRHTIDTQGKLMLKALKTINQTSGNLNQRLTQFRTQLQLGLDRINNLNVWYQATDHNRININFIASYQRALNFIQEVLNKYSNLLTTVTSRTSLWECIKLSDADKSIARAQTLLPDHLQIVHSLTEPIQIESDESTLRLQGFLPIIDIRSYELLKTTPVPEYTRDDIFTAFDIRTTIIGVNYNLQQYFEVVDLNFPQLPDSRYLVSKNTLYNINNRPNCVINEIYHAYGKEECPTHSFKLKKIIWKQLQTTNTWMFATPHPTPCQTSCHDNRMNIVLNGTGIVRLTQECSLFTDEFILTTDQLKGTSNFTVYVKPMKAMINSSVHQERSQDLIAPIVIPSSESFVSFIQEEEGIIHEEESMTWKQMRHHGYSITISIIASCVSILGCILCFRCRRKQVIQMRPADQPSTSNATWYDTKC